LNLYLHDWNRRVDIIRGVDELQWTTCAQDFGRFEMSLKLELRQAALIKAGMVVERSDCDDAMIITKIEIKDEETQTVKVSGRGCGAVLDRRAVWVNTDTAPPLMVGTIEQIIGTMIARHAGGLDHPARALPVVYEPMPGLPREELRRAVSWRPLGAAVAKKAQERGLGIRSIWRAPNGGPGTVVIQVYPITRNEKVFSKERETIAEQELYVDIGSYANFAIVAGEGDFPNREVMAVGGDETGLDRYEKYVNASDLKEGDYGGNYADALRNAGREYLQAAANVEEFSAMLTEKYVYKEDYDVGQIVPLQSAWGQDYDRLIAEVTESFDGNGYTVDAVLAPLPTISDDEEDNDNA